MKLQAGSRAPCFAYSHGAFDSTCWQDALVFKPSSVHQLEQQLQVLLLVEEAQLSPSTSWASHS